MVPITALVGITILYMFTINNLAESRKNIKWQEWETIVDFITMFDYFIKNEDSCWHDCLLNEFLNNIKCKPLKK